MTASRARALLLRPATLMLGLALALACAPSPTPSGTTAATGATAPTALLPIANARIPLEGVLSGGQPTREQIDAAARAGFVTVINLRADGEPGFDWEADAVQADGMRYVRVPIAGADDLTRENVTLFDAALRDARDAGPTLMHCGSGNRIGAMLALRAAWLEERDPVDALDYGLASGLTRLETPTRGLLGLDAPVTEARPPTTEAQPPAN